MTAMMRRVMTKRRMMMMTLSDLHALCEREWDTIGLPGDVIELRLTPVSRLQLALDMLVTDRASMKKAFGVTGSLSTVGALITEAVNPVTRSVVVITDSDDVDQALVSFGTWCEPELVNI
jgi:hypothetical protein